MASYEQVYTTTVKLNTEEVKNKLKELQSNVDKLRNDYKAALTTGDNEQIKKTELALKQANAEMKRFKTETMQVDDILKNLSDASIIQLQKAAKSLRAQMNALSTSSQEFKDKAQQLQKVNTALADAKNQFKAHEPWYNRMADGLNRWQTAIFGAIGAITGITMTVRKATLAYADMEESMANVRKYTGQTSEEIHDMNEEFKKMDTRTSREKLNELAGDAGRLGITGKKDIMDFVDAADKINVALGDDLGENAVRTIGKLSETFGDSDTMGLRGAMLATGSALNELAQSSSADAGYISEFTARFAGLGNQAHMTQTQIMGLASVLDQNMQQEETSSTALSQLMTKMYTEPQKFAKLAGRDIQTFSDLLKNDANEALLTFLQSMSDKGGFDALAPMFDEMGLSGVRCVGVLSTLATNLDEVRKQQTVAANAFSKGTSILDEFNVQSNTVQAGIDKNKKKFNEIAVELGEKLLPVVNYAITSGSLMMNGLSGLIDILGKYTTTIVTATVAISAYAVAANLASVKLQLWYYWTMMCEKAEKAWALVRKANPWALVATAVAVAVAGVIDYVRNTKKAVSGTKELTEEQKRLSAAQDSVGKKSDELISKYKTLQTQWKALSSSSAKNKWIKDNQTAFTELGVSIKDVNQAENVMVKNSSKVVAALKAVAEAQAYSEGYQKAVQKQAEFERKSGGQVKYVKANNSNLSDGEKEYLTRNGQTGVGGKYTSAQLQMVTEQRIKAAREAYNANKKTYQDEADFYAQKMTEAEQKVENATKGLNKAGISTNTSSGSTSSSSGSSKKDDAEKKALDRSKQIMAEDTAANELAYAKGEKLYSQYMEAKYRIQDDEYNRELAIYKKDSDNYKNVLNAKALADANYNNEKNSQTAEVYDKEEEYATRWAELNEADEEKRQELIFQIHQSYQKKRLALLPQGSKEYIDLESKMFEEQEEHKFELAKSYQKKVADFRKEYLKKSASELEAIDLKFAEDLHNKGLLSEEEYQKAIEEIKKKYAKKDDSMDMLKEYGSGLNDLSNDVLLLGESFAKLSERIKEGSAGWQDYAAVGEAALMSVMTAMSSLSSYYSASCDIEVAQVEAKYDAEIEAAGKNTKKTKKLEEQKEKEVAAIKTKYNEQAMNMEIAQAVASTAMAAINAYASAAQVPYVGYILGPIAAAAALAAGAIQIAAIKKQHEAEAAGYYEGGYTGGTNYRREAGVVHEGEFVANHNAVNNPAISPVLSLIDYAQQRNTVGTLNESDIASAVGAGGQLIAPIVNVSTDNAELQDAIAGMNNAVETLVMKLNDGIQAYSVIDGPNGTAKQLEIYNRLKSNK